MARHPLKTRTNAHIFSLLNVEIGNSFGILMSIFQGDSYLCLQSQTFNASLGLELFTALLSMNLRKRLFDNKQEIYQVYPLL